MNYKPEWNAQAEHELRNLSPRITKMPALVERPQAKRKMRSGGGVEHDRDDWISPPRQMVLQRGLSYELLRAREW